MANILLIVDFLDYGSAEAVMRLIDNELSRLQSSAAESISAVAIRKSA